MVGFPPGGGNDALTRLIAPKLTEKFGVPVVIDNRPGAGGNLAAQLTATAPPDGYTILMISSSHPIQGLLKKNLPYDPIRDFAGIAQLVVYRSLLVVYPGFPGSSVKTSSRSRKPNRARSITRHLETEPARISQVSSSGPRRRCR